MRRITVDERRARLGARHALAPGHGASSVTDTARAVVALHGTDPGSTVLAALARAPGSAPDDVAAALYDDRTLVRVIAFRNTVFAVPLDFALACFAGAADTVARTLRKMFHKLLVDSGVTDDPEPWLLQAEAAALEVVRTSDEVTSADLAAADPILATRLHLAPGTKYETWQGVASRLLNLLSAQGHVVRGRPKGGWTSTQFRWVATERWAPSLTERVDPVEATTKIARAWLHAYGPASPDDLQWWTGWTKTRMREALVSVDTVDVDLDGMPALMLAGDVDQVPAPDPWVALLPALDPSAMGWKHRDFCLGRHRELLYDVNGNAGPTVWADGRIVGGWAQRDDGEVLVRLLDDVGAETSARIGLRAAELTTVLGDVRLKARARGWTSVERDLRS
jgi:hypothetical protein